MKARVLTALALIPVAALVVHVGGWLFFVVALALAMGCLREVAAAVSTASQSKMLPVAARLFEAPCAAALALILLAAQALASPDLKLQPLGARLLFVLGGVIVVVFWASAIMRFGREGAQGGRLLVSLALSLAALAHVGLWAFAILLRARGEAWMWLALAGVWSSDTGAFFAGRALGKRKMSPLSPGKSWEGAVAGLLAAVALGSALGASTSIGLLAGAVCGAGVGVLAPLGDLAESLWKRELGVKDLGSILPGHGGLFDRCDSLLFAAAGVYALSWIWS